MDLVGKKIRFGYISPGMEKEEIEIVTIVSFHEGGMWVMRECGELLYHKSYFDGRSNYTSFEYWESLNA